MSESEPYVVGDQVVWSKNKALTIVIEKNIKAHGEGPFEVLKVMSVPEQKLWCVRHPQLLHLSINGEPMLSKRTKNKLLSGDLLEKI